MASPNLSLRSFHAQPLVMSTRVALYARVATSNRQHDPEMQLRELRERAECRTREIGDVYNDTSTDFKDSHPLLTD
jgi:predicted site-specific integrase-resolvase